MTRDEVLAATYPLTFREGDQRYLQAADHCEDLRAVADYEDPPPAFVFEGPISLGSLLRRQIEVYEIWSEIQDTLRQSPVDRQDLESQNRRYSRLYEGLAKAVPLAKAGREIYGYTTWLAVLVR